MKYTAPFAATMNVWKTPPRLPHVLWRTCLAGCAPPGQPEGSRINASVLQVARFSSVFLRFLALIRGDTKRYRAAISCARLYSSANPTGRSPHNKKSSEQ